MFPLSGIAERDGNVSFAGVSCYYVATTISLNTIVLEFIVAISKVLISGI